jgi:L-aspartate semialdehyde sulfurtransferase
MLRNIAEINEKIQAGQVVVWTVAELKQRVAELGVTAAAQQVDVITTGTFEPMEASSKFANAG